MTEAVMLGSALVAAALWCWAFAKQGWASAVVAAYAFFVPWGDVASLPFPGELSSVSTVIGLALIAVLIVDILFNGQATTRIPTATAAFLAFSGMVALSIVWSRSPTTSLRATAILAGPLAIYFLVAGHRWGPIDVGRFEVGAVSGAASISVLALARSPLGLVSTGDSGIPRFETVGGDANATAAALILPLAIATARSADASASVTTRRVWGGLAAVVFAGVFLTVSRGGLVAAVAAVGIVVVVSGQWRSLLRWGAGLAVVVVLLLAAAAPTARDHLASGDTTGRGQIWELGLHACAEECPTGSGFGTFPEVYQEEFFTNPDASGFQNRAFKAHNVFLQMGVELGFIGLAVFGLALALTVLDAARLPPAVRAAPLAGVIGLLITNSLITNADFKYFWLVPAYGAMVSCPWREKALQRDESRSSDRPASKEQLAVSG